MSEQIEKCLVIAIMVMAGSIVAATLLFSNRSEVRNEQENTIPTAIAKLPERKKLLTVEKEENNESLPPPKRRKRRRERVYQAIEPRAAQYKTPKPNNILQTQQPIVRPPADDGYRSASGRLWTGVKLYCGNGIPKMYVGEILGFGKRISPYTGKSFRGVFIQMRSGVKEWKDRDAIILGPWYVKSDDPVLLLPIENRQYIELTD